MHKSIIDDEYCYRVLYKYISHSYYKKLLCKGIRQKQSKN